MKEIGGYIELDEFEGKEYHKKAIALNSARHCLEYLIKAKEIKKIYIPYFMCSTVKDVCQKNNCIYEYYSINKDFSVNFNKNLTENEYIYIVNYYGQISRSIQIEYKKKYKNIIIDNVQAFFVKPLKNVDTIYSCRKFFGVSDGGYLYTNVLINEKLETDKSYKRFDYIIGRYETDAGSFFKEASNNNNVFDNEDLKYMSKLTHNILKKLNYKKIKKTRENNFRYLNDKLSAINDLKLFVPTGAFMYPLYINDGKIIKEKLIKNKVFVPTLWSDVFNIVESSSYEWDLASNIVPIPCDQRYNIQDMEHIIEIINKEVSNEKNECINLSKWSRKCN